jgi:uncharacterized membrane protein
MRHEHRALLTGLGAGFGLMYFLDPEHGRRRRALVRDQLARARRVTGDAAGATRRDAAHRASGAAARVRGALDHGQVDDTVLVERVRAQLGRLVSHPHAIKVDATDGIVTLRGLILQREVKPLLRGVERIRGVCEVVSELDEHKHAGNIPALQGGTSPSGPKADIWQRAWSPTTRLLTGTTGLALAGYGALRRDVPGSVLTAAGIGLVARAATNLEGRRLTGVGGRRRAVDLQKTITIDAPVDDVFAFWSDYGNFPQFLSRVLEVRPSSREGQSHWKVAGPAGIPVEFDTEISALVPNKVLGWRTIEGSPVAHAGLVRFESTDDGCTRVQVRMSYNPPGGWIGHGVASAFGVDPKTSLDADLLRMKTLLETGRVARDASQPASPWAERDTGVEVLFEAPPQGAKER